MTAPARTVTLTRMWLALISLLCGVVVLFGVAGVNQWSNQRDTQDQLDQLRRDLCALTTGLAGGPTPAPGPAGERARALAPLMDRLRDTSCEKRGG